MVVPLEECIVVDCVELYDVSFDVFLKNCLLDPALLVVVKDREDFFTRVCLRHVLSAHGVDVASLHPGGLERVHFFRDLRLGRADEVRNRESQMQT